MQIFLHALDGSSSVAVINESESFAAFLENYNLSAYRLVCQGSVLTQ